MAEAFVSPASAPAAETTSVHELKTLVLSRHSAIVVETPEEERLDEILTRSRRSCASRHFEWTVTGGLVRLPGGGAAAYGTQDAAPAIRTIGDLGVDAIFVLKDLGQLGDPAIPRALLDLLERLHTGGDVDLVLAGARSSCPRRSRRDVVTFELALPTGDEYRRTVAAASNRSDHRPRAVTPCPRTTTLAPRSPA